MEEGRPERSEGPASSAGDYLLFTIGAEHFAIDLASVEEAIDDPVIHFVPEMPPAMLGVISNRGALIPIYTPAGILAAPRREASAVLILREGRGYAGIMVDEVEDAVTLDNRGFQAGGGSVVMLGVARLDTRLISAVDASALILACRSAALVETT